MDNAVHRLDDAAMRHFVARGYLTIRPDFPAGFHSEIYQQLDTVIEKEGNCGNNILPRVPDLQQVFEHPQVRGTLTSILGPGYVMHPHRHCHLNPPGSREQQLHKDTLAYSGDPCPRHHRSRWAMAFYYPQTVTEEMGATGIMPGSQYYDTRSADPDNTELPLCGEAGTITIVHFDTWHRATENRSDRKRFMLKFIFGRMEDPTSPEWNAMDPEWRPAVDDDVSTKQEVAWRHLWNWLHGSRGTPCGMEVDRAEVPDLVRSLHEGDVTMRRRAASRLGLAGLSTESVIHALTAALGDPDEPVRLNAAYALGVIGEPAVPVLLGGLCEADDRVRQSLADALAAVGEPAVPALIRAARDADARVRSVAVDALGQIGAPAREAVPALATALRDESERVRRHAAEALGAVGAAAAAAVPALAAALKDEAPFVRFNAATALTRIGPSAPAAVPALIAGLRDPDRYVRGWSAMALQRIATPEAKEALLEFLLTSRWCPITSPASRY